MGVEVARTLDFHVSEEEAINYIAIQTFTV
jgi:hypothetical protein